MSGPIRAKVTAVQQVGGRVLVDVAAGYLDQRSRVELMLPAGMTILPQPGADVLLMPSGYHDHMVALLPDDASLRIAGLAAGEMGWQDYAGNQILFQATGLTLTAPQGLVINAAGPVTVNAAGHVVTVIGSPVKIGTGAHAVQLATGVPSTNLFAD